MIHPINQIAYIQEEVEQVSKFGILLPDARISAQGTIYAIEEDNVHGLKVGDHVLYSKFAAEDVDYKEDGKKIENLKSMHIDSINALIK